MSETDNTEHVDESEESKEGSPLEPVVEKVCVERVLRLTNDVKNVGDKVTSSITQLKESIDIVIENHKETLDKHDKGLENVNELVNGIGTQVTGLIQWKENGILKKEFWYKSQTFRTSVILIGAGIVYNAKNIAIFARGIFIAIGGGSP